MTAPFSHDDMAWAQHLMGKYQLNAQRIIRDLRAAYEAQDSAALAFIVRQLHDQNDLYLLNQLIGTLTALVAKSERAALEAHGPLSTRADAGFPDSEGSRPETWQVGHFDQCQAAIDEGDWEKYGKLALDGMIRSADNDNDSEWGYCFRVMSTLDQQTLTVLAAEMMSRLLKDKA